MDLLLVSDFDVIVRLIILLLLILIRVGIVSLMIFTIVGLENCCGDVILGAIVTVDERDILLVILLFCWSCYFVNIINYCHFCKF